MHKVLNVRLLFALMGVIGGLIVLEAAFRYYYFRWNSGDAVPFVLFTKPFPNAKDGVRAMVEGSDIPGVVYELKPRASYTFFGKPVVTNSAGLIGPEEFTMVKPPHTFRIAGVGDSFMFPWNVGMDETYLSVLGHMAAQAAPGVSVQVMNFAVPGYNTAIESSVIENKVLPYQPDLIVLGYVGNDMDLPNYIRRTVTAKSYLWYAVVHAVSFIACGMYKPACRYAPVDMLVSLPSKDGSIVTEPGSVPAQYRYMTGFDNYMKSMKHISDITRVHRISVVVTTVNDGDLLDSEHEFSSMGFYMFWGDRERGAYAGSHGLDESVFHISRDDPHFSVTGHLVTAELLYNFIMQQPDIRHILEQ